MGPDGESIHFTGGQKHFGLHTKFRIFKKISRFCKDTQISQDDITINVYSNNDIVIMNAPSLTDQESADLVSRHSNDAACDV